MSKLLHGGESATPLSDSLEVWRRRLGPLWLFGGDATPAQRFTASGLCAGFLLAAYIAKWSGAGTLFYPLIVLSYLSGGLRATLAAVAAARQCRPEINLLMVLAAVVSAVLQSWDEGAILLLLFSLSDALECYAMERTRRSVRALMDLRPETARVIRDEREFTVPLGELRVGDIIHVRPGERLPIDGVVVSGQSAVDESIVTGESLPVEKQAGSPIFAGTINTNGALRVEMKRPASDSTIARIVRLVEEAQSSRIGAQRIIEKWQSPYVIGVLCAAAAAILVGLLAGVAPFEAVRRGMILLVAASPCAVVLASPVAVLATVTRGARLGVLFKGGAHVERLAAVSAFALDKTGTITRGRPELVAVEPLNGSAPDEILAVAAALEHSSEHPLAVAITRAADARQLAVPELTGFENDPGFGVLGRIDGRLAAAGTARLFERRQLAAPPELLAAALGDDGQTSVAVWRDDGLAGVLKLRDEPRPDARPALAALRELGVERFVMLTGDHAGAASRVAKELGIAEYRADLRPEDKLAEIQRLAKEPSGVAMVGDGVNDAPALAAASVGIAMGAKGTDVALETADVVLMRDDLRLLPEAVRLARLCRDTIRRSLLFAFGVIGVLVTLSLLGWLSLPAAVVGHEGSTVLVVLNGLRILRTPGVAAGAQTSPGAHPVAA